MNGSLRSRNLTATSVLRALNGSRQLRTNRNSILERVDNEIYEGSDDEPLAQRRTQSSDPSPFINSPSQQSRIVAVSNSLITRSISRNTMPNAAHDHNYVSDMGTSTTTSSTPVIQRNIPRRILSRHQRNADELDSGADPLENPMLMTRLRSLPSTNSNEQQEQSDQPTVRRGRSRYSQDNSQSTPEQQDEVIPSDEGTDGDTRTPTTMGSEDDSEDNQPLTAIVPRARSRRLALERRTESVYINTSRSQRRSRRRLHVMEDEALKNRDKQQRGSIRGKRHQKRPRYNEQTDDDDENAGQAHKRRKGQESPFSNVLGDSADAENTCENSSDEQLPVTVSSRGRVRKLTVKARERQIW